MNRAIVASSHRLKGLVGWGVLMCLLCSAVIASERTGVQFSRSVVKVITKTSQGRSHFGSGVVIAEDKVATNCHVTRSAIYIHIFKVGLFRKVIGQAALPELDVCILQTQGRIPLPPRKLSGSEPLRSGEAISISAYPFAAGIRSLQGAIVKLHPYSGQSVIEINTGFSQGASGGGVFNQAGELIGLATFLTRGKTKPHFFAIPSAWVAEALKIKPLPLQVFSSKSFWENGQFKH